MLINIVAGAALLLSAALNGQVVLRSNVGTGIVMTDELPDAAHGGVLPANTIITLKNTDPALLYQVKADIGAALDGKMGGYALLGPGQSMDVASDGASYWIVNKPDRVQFGADTAFYVSPNGNDANSCIAMTTALACKTPQAAFDKLFAGFDMGAKAFKMQLDYPTDCAAPYVYPGFSIRGTMTGHYGSNTSGGNYTFQIVGKPGNDRCAEIHGVGMDAINVLVGKSLHVDWLTVSSDTSSGISANLPGTEMAIHNVGFGNCGGYHIYSATTAHSFGTETLNVYGSSQAFVYANEGNFDWTGVINFHGTLNFPTFLFGAARNANVTIGSATLLHDGVPIASDPHASTITGLKWKTLLGGVIDTGLINPNTFIPGSASGFNDHGGLTSAP